MKQAKELDLKLERYRPNSHIDRLVIRDELVLTFPGKPAVVFWADPIRLSGISDILKIIQFEEFFGDELDVIWLTDAPQIIIDQFNNNHPDYAIPWIIDKNRILETALGSISFIVDGSGTIVTQFRQVSIPMIRLHLNKIVSNMHYTIPKKDELIDGISLSALTLYWPYGTPLRHFKGALVYISPNCGSCEEWLKNGGIESIDGPYLLVAQLGHEKIIKKRYNSYLIDLRGTLNLVVDLGASKYIARYPSVIYTALEE